MKKKKNNPKQNVFRNTVTLLGILGIAQAIFISYNYASNDVMEMPEAIEDAVSGVSDPVEQARLKLNLALMQFRTRHGRLPNDFSELVPEFIADVPRNPKTGKEFELVVKGQQFQIAISLDEARLIRSSMSGSVILGQEDEEIDLDVAGLKVSYLYNPSGKRDPFLPYGATVDLNEGNCENPLLCTSLVKLRLALVIDTGAGGKKAMVETPDGRGHSVHVGSKLGSNNGEVVEILDDKVLILEQRVDLAGNKRSSTFELRLRDSKAGQPTKEGGVPPGAKSR